MPNNDVMSNYNITRPHTVWLRSRCFRVVGDLRTGLRKSMKMVEGTDTVEIHQNTEPLSSQLPQNPWNLRKLISGVYEGSIHVPRYILCHFI
jgi:hypothetical protein